MNKLEKWFIKNGTAVAATGATASLLAPLATLAQIQGPVGSVDSRLLRFETAITFIINAAIIVAGIAFVLLLLVGGVQYLASAGVEDNAKKAQRLMLNALIGLVIVVLAYAVGTYVLRLLGIGTGSTIPTQVR